MRVVIYGFGQIGRELAKACVKRGFDVVGAIDVNPNLIGKRLSDFGIKSDGFVSDKIEFEGDLAFVTTSSDLERVFPQIETCLKHGFNVISTCETLAYPEYRYPKIADRLDSIAKDHGVTVLGTGINPGFLLDTLPIVLSSVCVDVEGVKAIRKIDALKRRTQFQRKVGVGMSIEEFRRSNLSGHVGYAESALLIAEALGIEGKVLEGQEPIVENGKVLGIWGFGEVRGKRFVRIEFHAYAGAEEYELIEIIGDNGVVWKSSGIRGDLGTVAVLVNLAKTVVDHRPGLIKMTDLIPFKYV